MVEQSVNEVAEAESDQASEAQIAVHWREEGYYFPSAKFIGQANASDPSILERFSEKNYPECFKEYADLLTWDEYWHTTLDTSNAPFWKWFVGGRLNASYNCVDRHLEEDRNKAAIIWVPEPEDAKTEVITYQELYGRVNEFAALLDGFAGVKTGDVVDLPHAHGPRTTGRDARVRPTRRRSFAGVRRLLGRCLRRSHCRLQEQDPRHHRRLLPQRRTT